MIVITALTSLRESGWLYPAMPSYRKYEGVSEVQAGFTPSGYKVTSEKKHVRLINVLTVLVVLCTDLKVCDYSNAHNGVSLHRCRSQGVIA